MPSLVGSEMCIRDSDDTWFNRTWAAGAGNVTGDIAGACSGSDSSGGTDPVDPVDPVDPADPVDSTVAVFTGAFGGAVAGEGHNFTFPTGAESWAGFANDNTALYPFCFGEGGSVSFTGAAGFGDVDVFFRFENAPYPDTDPAFDTGTVTVSGGDDAAYSVSVPAQDAANTYSSFIMYVVTQDTAVIVKDVQVTSTDCASDPVLSLIHI